MVMMETTLRRTLSEKGRVTVLYCQLYCTVLHLEEDAEWEGEGDGDQAPAQPEQQPAEHADTRGGLLAVI